MVHFASYTIHAQTRTISRLISQYNTREEEKQSIFVQRWNNLQKKQLLLSMQQLFCLICCLFPNIPQHNR